MGTDGAASLVRRVASPSLDVELVPRRVRFPGGEGPAPETAVMRFYDGAGGYLWDFPRADHRSVGIGLPGRGWNRSRFDAEIDSHMESAQRCSCAPGDRAGAVIGTAQLGHGDYSRVGRADFALLGDAAGFADPTTGEGIQNALVSAELLAESWREVSDFSAYPDKAARAFEHEFRVGRLARRLLFETRMGARAIKWATRSRSAYALVAALTNAFNAHDFRTHSVVARWWRARRGLAESSAGAQPIARLPAACACVCSGTSVEAHDLEAPDRLEHAAGEGVGDSSLSRSEWLGRLGHSPVPSGWARIKSFSWNQAMPSTLRSSWTRGEETLMRARFNDSLAR